MLMRIGARIPLLVEATRCACGRSRPLHEAGKIAWDCGDHHSACAARGAGDLAHNTVNTHGLAQMARAAHIPTRIEVRGGYGHMANTAAGGSQSRPDLVLYGFPNMGTKTTVDLTLTTVVSGLNAGESTTRTDAAAKTTAHSADQAEAAKQSSYARRHPEHFGAAFRGLAYEHHGCPGKDMDCFLRQVATYHVLGHGTIGADKDREQKIQYNRFITKWRQRLSTTLQRALAQRILTLTRGHHPSGGYQDHDYEAGMGDQSYPHNRRAGG